MASVKTYVTKFKSFVILFFTPILLLPLIILVPDKVSCVSGKSGGTQVPSAITGTELGNAELERTDPAPRPRGEKLPWVACSDAQGTRCPAKNPRYSETLGGEHVLERTNCRAQELSGQTPRPGC